MNSIWTDTVKLSEFPTLEGNIKTDVLIIGGGLSGILTAYMLKRKGIDCILVEKDRVCRGTTGNTTAKITYQHGLIYSKLNKSHGTKIAALYLKANKAAFDKYAALCKDIDCDYEIKDNFVYSLSNRAILEAELNILEKIGYKAEFCQETPLPFINAGAVMFPGQAQFNPLKFVSKIISELNIYENTFVREMKGNIAVTDKGEIHADKVIVTTHFPFINKHGFYFLKLYQHRSYAISLENAQNVGGMYVDESKTGYSFRNYGNKLILGGGSHRTGKKGGCWQELRSFVEKHYPKAEETACWATQDCMSLDGMPYIGRYSSRTNDLYVSSGFNKWGMTGAMLSAMILSDTVIGRKNEFAEIFDPSRSIMTPQLAVNCFEAIKGILTPTIRRCPHLGCALKWNSAEHSWDCSCHGSRFNGNGRVIDNPANGDMN